MEEKSYWIKESIVGLGILITAIVTASLTSFFGKRKNKAEISKITAETKQIEVNTIETSNAILLDLISEFRKEIAQFKKEVITLEAQNKNLVQEVYQMEQRNKELVNIIYELRRQLSIYTHDNSHDNSFSKTTITESKTTVTE